MKQFTTTEQTAKLIALGFEKPSPNFYRNGVTWIQCEGNYSIGELIEMLPITITHEIWWEKEKGKEGVWGLRIDTRCTDYGWNILYERPYSAPLYLESRSELVDALYDMVINLKEEKII
jgi:hypothetical protein